MSESVTASGQVFSSTKPAIQNSPVIQGSPMAAPRPLFAKMVKQTIRSFNPDPEKLFGIEKTLMFTTPEVTIIYDKNHGLTVVKKNGKKVSYDAVTSLMIGYNQMVSRGPMFMFHHEDPTTNDNDFHDLLMIVLHVSRLTANTTWRGDDVADEWVSHWIEIACSFMGSQFNPNVDPQEDQGIHLYIPAMKAAIDKRAEAEALRAYKNLANRDMALLLDAMFSLDGMELWFNPFSIQTNGFAHHPMFELLASNLFDLPVSDPFSETEPIVRYEVKSVDRSKGDFALFIWYKKTNETKPAHWQLTTNDENGSIVAIQESQVISVLVNTAAHIVETGRFGCWGELPMSLILDLDRPVGYVPQTPPPWAANNTPAYPGNGQVHDINNQRPENNGSGISWPRFGNMANNISQAAGSFTP